MNISPASPYAAPQTPIASAKRPKIHLRTHSKRDLTPENDINGVESSGGSTGSHSTPDMRRLTVKANLNRAMMATCTPSKIMFSPGLRAKSCNALPPHPSGESDHESESDWNIAHDASFSTSNSDQNDDAAYEEIKQYTVDDNLVPEVEQVEESPAAADDIYAQSLDSGNGDATITADEEDDDENAFNPYAFMAQLPDPSQVARVATAHLPPAEKTPLTTLVLDLDETLVHCTVDPVEKADMIFPVEFNGTMYKVYGRKRPYLDYFLEQVSKSFEVVLFTASQRVYADVLLDIIDPEKRLIKHRLFRESCLLVQGSYLKDLQVLGRDLKKTVLVDNSPYAYGYQVDNGVPIESWYDDDKDTELLKLLGFLKRIQATDDVRPLIRSHFKTYELINNASAKIQAREANSKKLSHSR